MAAGGRHAGSAGDAAAARLARQSPRKRVYSSSSSEGYSIEVVLSEGVISEAAHGLSRQTFLACDRLSPRPCLASCSRRHEKHRALALTAFRQWFT